VLRETRNGAIAVLIGAAISLAVVRIGLLFHMTATEALLVTMGIAVVVVGVIYAVPSWRKCLRPVSEMRHVNLETDQGKFGFDYSAAAGSVRVVRLNGDGTTDETYTEWGELGL
jgi:hypothetical protein